MRKILSILLVLFIIVAFVACDPEQSGTGGSGENQLPKATYQVTFIQEGLDNVVETYTEGELLWVHAPDLPENVSGHYYNWSVELDSPVTSNMKVTRTDNTGHAVLFKDMTYSHVYKIVPGNSLKVEDFPATPEIEGYTGEWWEYYDLSGFWEDTYTIVPWYYSTDTYSSTGMPKTFLVPGSNGVLAFILSEYPIKVTGDSFKYVNETNLPSAIEGLTQITESECAAVVDFLGNTFKTTYATYDAKQATDCLIENKPNLGFVNAIKVMRQETGDNTWSIPRGSELAFALRRLAQLGTENAFYSYLSAGSPEVNCINNGSFFVSLGHQRMVYSYIVDGEPRSSEYLFGNTFNGYLWPIKQIEL